MVLFWVYQKFVESRLNVPTLSDDKDKYNKLCSDTKVDETNNLELSQDYPNQSKRMPAFQKKRVFYFSPNYFSKDDSNTVDSMHKFYLKCLNENYSSYSTGTKYHYIAKTDEDTRSFSSFQDRNCNNQETFPPENYAKNSRDLEKQLKNDVADQCASSLISQAPNILDYYLIFPLYVTKMIFDCHNAGYYYVKYPTRSNIYVKSPEIDIYSVDDLTFENVCLQEVEKNIEEPPCNLWLNGAEYETDSLYSNDNNDEKYNPLKPEVNKPYYTMKSETDVDSMSLSDLCEDNSACNKFHAYFTDERYKHIQADEANDSDITTYQRKLESSFYLEKYDFSLAKFFRKMISMNRMKPKDKEHGSTPD